MVKDINSVRRMIASKYSNRPPFDIKKIDSSTITEDLVENDSDFCKNCVKNNRCTSAKGAQKAYISVAKYLNHKIQNKQKNVIPKVIESFQKVTPSKLHESSLQNRSRNMSIQTLYRNNNIRFGKNLPDHRLMKDLLKNLESDDEHNAQDILDRVPTKETKTLPKQPNKKPQNTKVIRTSESKSVLCSNERVDKKTSTTGLTWIPGQPIKFVSNMPKFVECESSTKPKKHRKCKIPVKMNVIKEAPTEIVAPSNASTYTLCFEHCAVKDECATMENRSKRNAVYPDKSGEGFDRKRAARESRRPRERSFVSEQVEKLNRLTKQNNFLAGGKPKSGKHYEDQKNNNKNYINLMERVRKNVPQMHRSHVPTSKNMEIADSEWSDTAVETSSHVRFPRETKNAMDRLKGEKIPLTKFSRNCEHFQPAIRREKFDDLAGGDRSINKQQMKPPCSRNLLCQLGVHEGSCKVNKARKK